MTYFDCFSGLKPRQQSSVFPGCSKKKYITVSQIAPLFRMYK